ncbi:unnamed protein product [Thlaspi arvense]|uniref:Ycf20-like protein n=1 Tax=Thlaspi arvense TaxID=13288 RepID=A0AAU9SEA2_THLAR|nr:unnamed protein product [Thlaspi arvense]
MELQFEVAASVSQLFHGICHHGDIAYVWKSVLFTKEEYQRQSDKRLLAKPDVSFNSLKMSWTTIRSSVGGGRFDPPSGSGSSSNKSTRRPRLIKALQDLRTKLLVKIEEIKKDLPMKLLFLLVGFYSATAFSTFIGQTGDWDVLSAALAVIVVECIGALMYRASIPLINKMRSIITIFNYWKTGLALGLFLDSFKYEV